MNFVLKTEPFIQLMMRSYVDKLYAVLDNYVKIC